MVFFADTGVDTIPVLNINWSVIEILERSFFIKKSSKTITRRSFIRTLSDKEKVSKYPI